jgi:hypothetical protein
MKFKTVILLSFIRKSLPVLIGLILLTPGRLFAQKSELDLGIVECYLQELSPKRLSDTMVVRFNLFKKGKTDDANRLLYLEENDSIKIIVREFDGKTEDKRKLAYIPGSLKKYRYGELKTQIAKDATISLLVDRSGSIEQDKLDEISKALKELFDGNPNARLYYSWFGDEISESIQVTKENLDNLDFSILDKNSFISLYNAIFTKLQEFDLTQTIPTEGLEKIYKRNRQIAAGTFGKNFLIVLTGGKNLINLQKYSNSELLSIWEPDLFNKIDSCRDNIDIYALGFDRDSKNFDEELLKLICVASGNSNGYYSAGTGNISNIFDKLGKKMAAEKYDYEIKLKQQASKKYRGEARRLELEITSNSLPNTVVHGLSMEYRYGTLNNEMTSGPLTPLYKILLWGLIVGIITGLLIMIVVQLIIPLIKNKVFKLKYVKKYKPAGNELHKECQYCGDPLNPSEKVVIKCNHIVHHVCWKDFDHMCPEYGQNCNDGKEDYFDISDPFSKKNKIYYLSWVLYGLIGGFMSWIIYELLNDWDVIYRFTGNFIRFIKPGITLENLHIFEKSIAMFLLAGLLMGFFFILFFSHVEEYRHKNLFTYGKILIRGLLGGIFGFISFLTGSVFLIFINMPKYEFLFDWIPWILFGVCIGFIMSIKTTIFWKHGVIGGIISIIFCFIMIYAFAGGSEENAILVGFMIYGAGFGISIATVRSQSEHFFLKILQGKKNQDIIPIHKWMSYSGGHNEVYIGRGFACEIQMNWEQNNEEIAQKHAKMYINSRSMPVFVSLVKGKTTYFNNRFDCNIGKEYELYNGVLFKIGETVFQYMEKD